MWKGLPPPQIIFARRRFKKVLLDPPNFNPGSWCGAGRLWIDGEDEEYWLTSRPRVGEEKRGYAVEIYRSRDGENYHLINRIHKDELSEIVGVKVHSIENQQLLRDPFTGRYFLYLSVDVSEKNIAGRTNRTFESIWQTYLLSSEDPAGAWRGEGFVLKCDRDYDSAEARDSTIEIIDGRYVCLYKARRLGERNVYTAIALSPDGKEWIKLGIPRIDGKSQRDTFLLNGSIFPGCAGPIFIGAQTLFWVKGAHLTKHFAAYIIDYRNLNLEKIFVAEWAPGSLYEHPEFPIHTYSDVVHDIFEDRWLIQIEAVDPTYSREPGLNLEVDRVLLYISK